MQALAPWRVVRALVERALVKWDSPAMVPLAVSLGSLSNPWPERRLHLVGRCPVALVHQAQAWAWLVAWAPLGGPWVHRVARWVAWA